MAIAITSASDHHIQLSALRDSTTGPIRIASAYVTEPTLFQAGEREIRLLTGFSTMDVVSSATSLKALQDLAHSGVKCRRLPTHPRLHAKVYIFDKAAVVTSANLTLKALQSNIEVGVQVDNVVVQDLIAWFDELWAVATPLTVDDILDLQNETAGLRKQFAELNRQCKKRDKKLDVSSNRGTAELQTSTQWLDTLDPVQDLRVAFFICNTNRRYTTKTKLRSGVVQFDLEERMRAANYAAVWEDFNYEDHMSAVTKGDVIFMFAKSVGIIGIGIAEGTVEHVEPKRPGRIRTMFDDDEATEWRIPVAWARWVEDKDACKVKGLMGSFINISGEKYTTFRNKVREHFLGAL